MIYEGKTTSLQPQITDAAVRASMDFFTYRFLFGASILSADLRKRTWQRAKKNHILPENCRWNIGAALLLKASAGLAITPKKALRAGPMFRQLFAEDKHEKKKAADVYAEALAYLLERGFGKTQVWPEDPAFEMFLKTQYYSLPISCREQLAEIRVHPISFGLHLDVAAKADGWPETDDQNLGKSELGSTARNDAEHESAPKDSRKPTAKDKSTCQILAGHE